MTGTAGLVSYNHEIAMYGCSSQVQAVVDTSGPTDLIAWCGERMSVNKLASALIGRSVTEHMAGACLASPITFVNANASLISLFMRYE